MQRAVKPEEIIRHGGFRATRPRIAVLSFLKKSKYPVSIQDITVRLARSVDQVSVYRIVEAFEKAGLVRRVDFRLGKPLYELDDIEHDHHHVVCTACKRVEDFEDCGYERVAKRALKQAKGFARIDSHALEFFGVCKACAK